MPFSGMRSFCSAGPTAREAPRGLAVTRLTLAVVQLCFTFFLTLQRVVT